MWKLNDEDRELLELEQKWESISHETEYPSWYERGDILNCDVLEGEEVENWEQRDDVDRQCSFFEQQKRNEAAIWNEPLGNTACSPAWEPRSFAVVPEQVRVQMKPAESQVLEGTVVLEKKSLLPFDVVQELIRREKIVIHRNAIYFYDGRIFRLMVREEMERLIVDLCRGQVEKVGTPSFVKNIYDALYREPTICEPDFEASPDHLVFEDGVLNLKTGAFHGHTPSICATSMLRVNYQRGCQLGCPSFDRFVRDIADGDVQLEQRIWEALGYIFTQDHRAKCFFLLQGPPDSGKSVLGDFVRVCYERDAVSALDLRSLSKNFAKADLIGKSLCIDLDLSAAVIDDGAISELKKLTGRDLLSTDIKYMSRVSFVNTAKILYASNHPVLGTGVDEAFLRRMIVIPLKKTIPKEKQDFYLREKLANERDAVVVKALRFYKNLRARNYEFSGNYEANSTITTSEDLVSKLCRFYLECCELAEGWTPTEVLYSAFVAKYGEICTKRTFSEKLNVVLKNFGVKAEKDRQRINGKGNPVYGFEGIRIRCMQV